ncbi:hypothetical protein EKO04_004132 [Ascochyta lentis]|uniref:Uncharacterized protein n=1 Tax=Ascochyta lentis TaxID=205686 RepID=A0A8H7J7T7_9PLEO|nr:hypothetical protein EKO04_004132 [Ascochyta lentis]
MDDWQDHALSTRHMHNRNSRRASGKGRKGAAFDVRKTFGEYDVKCASWERALGELEDVDRVDEEAGLELLRLTEDGQGVLGELVLPGVLRAAVVLAASRKILQVLTAQLSGEGPEEEEESDNESHEDGEDDDSNEHEPEEEQQAPTRFTTFEKNSFRSPKFWLAWNGTLSLPASDSPPPSPTHSRKTTHFPPTTSSDSPPPSPTLSRTGSSFPPPKPASSSPTHAEGLGYVTFAGNECRKFKGTLSCKELGWKDVAFSGFKSVSRSESDRQVVWGGRDVETGWREGEGGGEERGARLDGRRRVVFD